MKLVAEYSKKADENGKYRPGFGHFSMPIIFILLVYEVYNDVRLVGTPPESIGKFGQ